MANTNFDKTETYKALIEPKVQELRKLCSQENMPMFIAVCTKNNNNTTVFEKEVVSAVTHGLSLKEDIIPKLINVTLGFDTVLPTDIPDIEFE